MVALLLLMAQVALGAGQANHYFIFTVQGGEASTMAAAQGVKLSNLAGYQLAGGLGYEIRANHFFINLGAQADWQSAGQRVEGWTEPYNRLDPFGNPVTYNYRYSFLEERQKNLQVAPMLQLGGYLGQYVYVAAGVKVRLTLQNEYASRVNMTTDGVYEKYIQPVQNSPVHGYYPTDVYKGGGKQIYALTQPVVAPMVEVGAKLPIHTPSHRVGMRVGAYIEYGLPIGWEKEPTSSFNALSSVATVMDYRQVDLVPQHYSQQNLKDNLLFHSVLRSDWMKSAPGNLSVGLKLTVMFNVTAVKSFCNCDADFAPIQRKGGTRISK